MQSWAFAANVGTIDATNIVANLFYTYHVVFVTRIKKNGARSSRTLYIQYIQCIL